MLLCLLVDCGFGFLGLLFLLRCCCGFWFVVGWVVVLICVFLCFRLVFVVLLFGLGVSGFDLNFGCLCVYFGGFWGLSWVWVFGFLAGVF